MKTFKLSLAALTLIAAVTFSSCNQETPVVEEEVAVVVEEGLTGDYIVSAEVSKLAWLGTKITGEHTGSINIQEGYFTLSAGALTGAKVVVDMTSIVVEDITDAEMNAKLTGHLNSEDFFNTAGFPTASLSLTEGDEANASGDLTIKGITNPVKFSYTVVESETEVVLEGAVMVDRTLYDIKYGSGKFFENLGDKTISDEFELKFNVVSIK